MAKTQQCLQELVLNFLPHIGQILRCNIFFQILGQIFGGPFQVFLICFEHQRMVVLAQVVGEHIGIDECLTALTQYVESFFQKLKLNRIE